MLTSTVNRFIRTNFGFRLADEPASFVIPLDPVERRQLACALDREADLALSEGRILTADRLSWRAEMLREVAL